MNIAPVNLTPSEREQIATVLNRRANEVAGWLSDHAKSPHYPDREGFPASVEYGLELEMRRLRRLADLVDPRTEKEES